MNAENNWLLVNAVIQGNIKDVQRLITLCDRVANTAALRAAANIGNFECVKLLIPVSEPNGHDNEALKLAALNGHVKCLGVLIPFSEPRSENSWALQAAVANGHPECVDLLFEVSDPQVAVQSLQLQSPNDPKRWQYLTDKIAAADQRALLANEVKEVTNKHSTAVRRI